MGNFFDLSDDEKVVARLISSGYSAKQISNYLGLQIGVVDYKVECIKRKLSCNKNTQIAFIVSRSLE